MYINRMGIVTPSGPTCYLNNDTNMHPLGFNQVFNAFTYIMRPMRYRQRQIKPLPYEVLVITYFQFSVIIELRPQLAKLNRQLYLYTFIVYHTLIRKSGIYLQTSLRINFMIYHFY